MNKAFLVDYGRGNLGSVRRALEECGAEVVTSDDPAACAEASHIVLPGVGAFADCMAALEKGGWVEALRGASLQDGIPLLGICLGMQLLADRGLEGRVTAGLGLIPGEVVRLEPDGPQARIPHVGWNEAYHGGTHPLFSGIASGTDFYFVHSYHFVPLHAAEAIASTPYCGSFVSAVARGKVCGTQFHPEKSSRAGFQLLRNFLSL